MFVLLVCWLVLCVCVFVCHVLYVLVCCACDFVCDDVWIVLFCDLLWLSVFFWGFNMFAWFVCE